MNTFEALELAQPILRAVAAEDYDTPTPIQQQSIPPLLAGRDLLGVAQTGTGKTAAFSLPLLHKLAAKAEKSQRNNPLALILAPTRELAGQIADSLRVYGRHVGIRTTTAFGGVSIRPQIQKLSRGVHILVATPGRLLDLMKQGHLRLDLVEVFILDEADRMLDMGFINDVRKITAAMPRQRQTVLFSATMPKSVLSLADGLLTDPVHVEVTPTATTVDKVEQRVLFVEKQKKRSLLADLLKDRALEKVLVFTRTKHGADRVAKHLAKGGVKADAIHGNKSQGARQKALDGFKYGNVRVLVATDLASRGIDVDGISHVINFELPNDPESYVHRIGRTARAGASGIAISFCDLEERDSLKAIEKTIRDTLLVTEDHPFHSSEIAQAPGAAKRPPRRNARPSQGRRRKSRGNRSKGKAA